MAFDPISKPPDRRALALLVLGLGPLGCAESAEEPPAEARTPAAVVEPAPAPEEPSAQERAARADATEQLRGWLSSQVVTMDQVFRDRPIVYTWTRAEQVEELRRRPRLLSRSRDRNGERGAFAGHIDADPHPLAQHLRRATRRRFGWTNPWATRGAVGSAHGGASAPRGARRRRRSRDLAPGQRAGAPRDARAFAPSRCYVASLGARRADLPMTFPHVHLNIVPVPDDDTRPREMFTWQHGVLDGSEREWSGLREELAAAWDEADAVRR